MKEFAKVYLKATGKRDNPPQGHFPYIGSGEGTIEGDSISGKIDWTLFEDQSKAPCDANLIGTITTDDGATIEFEALGFFKQDGDSKMYTLTSGIRFSTDDGRYSNLRENLGLMTGKGDVEVFEMKHRIFLSELADDDTADMPADVPALAPAIAPAHLAEAIQYRKLDRGSEG